MVERRELVLRDLQEVNVLEKVEILTVLALVVKLPEVESYKKRPGQSANQR